MRPFVTKLVSALIIFIAFTATFSSENSRVESRLIRRLFLDVRNVPPSPAELNWYLCYNHEPYKTAVEWISSQNQISKDYFLSDEYKQKFPTKLDQSTLDLIVKYQGGNINVTNKEADKLLVKVSIAGGEENTTDVIDYMSSCLMARSTNVQETNELLKIYKQYLKEEDGYLAVLDKMKTYSDYMFK